jgi:hypothetical protein
MGVIFFIKNAVFALVLLIMVLVSSGFAIFTKNPDTRYQPMRDDRGSFIKSQTQLTTELDALGATARGEGKGTHPRIEDDDDAISISSADHQRQMANKEGGFSEHYQPAPPRSPMNGNFQNAAPTSPYASNTSMPAQAPPSYYKSPSPVPSIPSNHANSLRNDAQYRAANNSSPWQRGAGYDH